MGVQPFYGKGQHLSLWAGSQAAHGKITVSSVCNYLNHRVIFRVQTQFMQS